MALAGEGRRTACEAIMTTRRNFYFVEKVGNLFVKSDERDLDQQGIRLVDGTHYKW